MKLTPLEVAGVQLVEIERHVDERGFFARVFCADELGAHGVVTEIAQMSVSFNPTAGTLRGMHWQEEPHGEDKVVRATRGRAFDAIVDLRADSPTYGVTSSIVLDADEHSALYIPRGVAHGFLTLVDDTELLYSMSVPHNAASGRGLRWDDPGLDVAWPTRPAIISERDATYPDHPWLRNR